MKRILLIAAFATLMSLWRVSAQDITPAVTENWTVHTVYTGATGNSLATDITYYNGLGLKEQHIQVGASMSGRSIVKPFRYDSALREAYDYVAYETNRSTYDLQTNAMTNLEEYCHNTFNEYRPFSYTRFEAHPEGRPIRVIAPGYAYYYSQRNPTIEYGTNTSSEVRIISSDSAGALVIGGSYAAGTLKKETVKDEDGRTVITFKDKIGNIILERQEAGDTYYVYDNYFRLCYVMPPKASSNITSPATHSYESAFCKVNCYSYRYDDRRRVVVKRLPQCGEEYIVYDDCDRVIGRQSATDRENGVWWTSAYDSQGRLYRESSINSSKTREEFQNSPETTSGNVYNAYYYYDTYPTSMSDDLGFISVNNVVSSSDMVQNTNGLMTYKLVRDPYPSTGFPPKFHYTAFYYDYLGRMIQSVEKDPDGHIHRLSCNYDFTGNVTVSVEEMAGVTKKTECTYDERGRLKVEKTYVNGTLLSDLRYSYDIYGHITQRLENKNGLLNNYTYDIHGRQTAQTSHRAGTHIYSDEMKYNSTYDGAMGVFSGNISAWNWKRHDNSCDTLMFLYDSSNRLIKAATLDNGVATNRFSENNITYDGNGNILTLNRYKTNTLEQSICNSYSGNQLSGCTYDSNGNMTYDSASGLTMEWNHLNLIKKVSDGDGVLVNYTYLADGTKTRAVDADGEGLEYRGSLTFRRSSDGTLTPESIAFSGGRIVAVTGSGGAVSFVANHHVTDHLGSVRAVVDGSTGQVVETNDYYAFGGRWDRSGNLIDQSNRYRYNGKEEQTTFGTPYSDYGARQYSSASGRWLAVDPLAEKYYGISPYAFCNNNPVNFVDPDGMRIVISTNGIVGIEYQWKEVGGIWGFYDTNDNLYSIGENQFVYTVSRCLSELMTTKTGSSLVQDLVKHSESVFIRGGTNAYDPSKKAVGFNPSIVEPVPVKGGMNSDFSSTFIHELAHALYDISGGEAKQWFLLPQGDDYEEIPISEIFTTHVENKFRAEKELPLRTHYAKDEFGQPCGPEIVAPGTKRSRYYRSDGTTNYKRLKKNETPYEY